MPAYLFAKKRLWSALAGLLFCLLLAGPAWAADIIWTGAGTGNTWGDVNNWVINGGGVPAAVPGPGDTATFNTSFSVDLGQDRTVDALTINTATLRLNDFNLQVTDLTISAVTEFRMTSGRSLTVNNGTMAVNARLNFESGDLVVNGSNNITGTGLLAFDPLTRLYLNGDQNLRLEPVINNQCEIFLSNSALLTFASLDPVVRHTHFISGDGSINIQTAGTVIFGSGGQNTYSGSTTVSAGTLDSSNCILPTDTDLTISPGAKAIVWTSDLNTLSGSGDLEIDTGRTVRVSGTCTFSGDISESGAGTSLEKNVASTTLTLTGDVDTDIVLNTGGLVFNGTAQQNITQAGGTLRGTGTCNGLLTVQGGGFEPGGSIGVFNASGGLTMAGPGSLNIELSGANSDRVNVNGAVNLTAPNLNLSGTPSLGAVFTIIDNDGADAVTGIFAGLAEGQTLTSGGNDYEITYAGGDGNDVVLTCTGVAPGPPAPDPDPDPEPDPDPGPTPGAPKGTSPNPATSLNGPSLSWPKVSGARAYRVYRAACPTCDKEEIGRVSDTSFVDQSALPDQVYYYFVRGEGSGGLSDYSDWMAAWRYEQNPGRAGDFNGDGIADLLWWEPDTNEIKIWLMKGGAVQSVVSPGAGQDISQWLLINTGDFNQDGVCDIMWWNPEAGAVEIWYLSRTQGAASNAGGFQATSSPGQVSGNSTLSYTGDLNGDEREDILWRNYETGEVTLWIMGVDGQPQLNGPPTLAAGVADGGRPGITGSLEWGVRGLFDMDGDGKADVIWQHASDGRVVVWRMDGSQALGFVVFQQDSSWRIAGMGDLDGDGSADFVWSNPDNGAIQTWLMRGFFTDELVIVQGSAEAAKWQVKAVGDFCAPGCDDVYCKNADTGKARIIKLDGREFYPTVE
jgi:autotransporter-associated beta strand protein